MQWINVNKTNHTIRWIVIYAVDSVIQPLNNPGGIHIKMNARLPLLCSFPFLLSEKHAAVS